MVGTPQTSDGLASGPCTLARRFSEEPDQDPERPDGADDEDEQVNDRDAQGGDSQLCTSFRIEILTVSYTRPYSASLGSQGVKRGNPGTIIRLHNM